MPADRGDRKREHAADLMHSAAIHLLRFVRREDTAAGVSAPQLSALSVLVFAGPQTMGSLAAAEQVKMSTMSRTVDDLERQRLAERAGRPVDRRVIEVRVTDAGRQLLQEGRRRRLHRLAASLRGASTDEIETLVAAARIVLRATDPAEDGDQGASG
jgi:DNA-binding MarR family transcriptional regulator